MGFEYGYSVENLDALVCWEAQFGDFADGAQSVVDEFISSGEVKWGQRNAVTLLLPHGHEGQGPDHTSARPSATSSCAPRTTCGWSSRRLRRTTSTCCAVRRCRAKEKPLVVFTPKSLLRHRLCVSSVADFTTVPSRRSSADTVEARRR